jgi:nucleoid-associated protein YgaU
MKWFKVITLLVIGSLAVFSSALLAQSYNYEEMKMDEYNAELAKWQGRLDAAQTGIQQEDAKIADLQGQHDGLQTEIDGVWDEIFAALGKTRADNEAYVKELQQLRADASALLSMSPEEIYKRKAELQAMKDRLAEMQSNNLSYLSENEKVLNEIESLLMQAEEKGKPAVPDTYSVMRGDFLWKIASKQDIYADPYAWSRIYTSNTDQIKDPNLIYPNQIFRIPRDVGPNEHLVAKGEFLSKISGYTNVYGSPFQWQKLYEANKGFIEDPNLIYPYQVLKIAR